MSKAAQREREEEKAREQSKKARLLQEVTMEVAADDDQPFPAPYPKKENWWATKRK